MAERAGTDDGLLTSPNILRDLSASGPGDVSDMDPEDSEDPEVSLEDILVLYNQPINEEQAWAVCYQCCRTLARSTRRRKGSKSGRAAGESPRRVEGPGDVKICSDGTVRLDLERSTDKYGSASTSLEVMDSLGVMIYKALDFGLKENEERELSPPLERLIDMMTNPQEAEGDLCPDEGYEATEEEEEDEEEEEERALTSLPARTVSQIRSYRDVVTLCSSHLPSPSDAPDHYQAVVRVLYTESRELRTFLEKIKSAKENLRKMEGETQGDPAKDLDELQNSDWAQFWVQVMRDLRHGVQLKKVQERQYNPLVTEYQLTPYEMLMGDIRLKRYKLRKVMVNGVIPPRLKKSAHEVILEFIRSRPPLNPVSARKLKPHPPRPPSLHERLLEDIKAERKLRPVSPDLIRRKRLGAGKSMSTPQDLCRSSDTPDGTKKMASSTQSLIRGTVAFTRNGAKQLSQRKRVLKAPTLAELDSSESEEENTRCSSLMDLSPDAVKGKKMVCNSGVSDKQQRIQSMNSDVISPYNDVISPYVNSLSSKSLEELCFPVECVVLTVEEVMHIRQVLVKAELEKFQQYKDVYAALKKGKLCFSCRTKRFSFFTWSYTCHFCKRPVCSQCFTKMRLPSKPYSTLPIYTLSPSTALTDNMAARDNMAASPDSSKEPFGSAQNRRSLRRFSRAGKDEDAPLELELPKELMEDWVVTEVCVDCKKFITEIISSSRRSITATSKRARLNRRTQSFYMASSSSLTFRPSNFTINEA
ncbi:protein spire homolog 1-like isoform X2 [Entelurus aequoreus]|uniref:protein spire homolog 1-like isoform X2 n=1 Tax=Entelurus aequoreus TaxID=161455 RepID=UPI002B1D563F|nr:protein spire homolog 1-like isoform X2 [Entelurus aequoreus]